MSVKILENFLVSKRNLRISFFGGKSGDYLRKEVKYEKKKIKNRCVMRNQEIVSGEISAENKLKLYTNSEKFRLLEAFDNN